MKMKKTKGSHNESKRLQVTPAQDPGGEFVSAKFLFWGESWFS